jgi:TM2 domain-containing membrane protein YozV
MSKALMKRSSGNTTQGVVSGAASAVIPGLGQLINGEGDKAIGVFAVWGIAGLSLLGAIPIIGTVAWAVGGATWIYGVADGYITGKKK